MKAVVLSDGGWGTALALLLGRAGHRVALWGPFPEYIDQMRESRRNSRYLPGIELHEDLALEPVLGAAVRGAEVVVLAAPSQYLRPLLEKVRGLRAAGELSGSALFVNVAKGIEVGTLKRMSELTEDLLGHVPYAVLSGPSHAEEVARGVPTAVVAAAGSARIAAEVQHCFTTETFRVYTSSDVTGVELGGALKNVLALAAGVCDGMGFGDNTKAALMTRGIVEMARLGSALGGHPETFNGLSGVGDLIVTCMSRHSRNRYVGQELGKGRKLADIQAEMGGQVAEGVTTARSAWELARKTGVETPIVDQIHASLYEGRDPREAVRKLMTRDTKPVRR